MFDVKVGVEMIRGVDVESNARDVAMELEEVNADVEELVDVAEVASAADVVFFIVCEDEDSVVTDVADVVLTIIGVVEVVEILVVLDMIEDVETEVSAVVLGVDFTVGITVAD